MGEMNDLVGVGGDDIHELPDHAGQVLDNIHLCEKHLKLRGGLIDEGLKWPRIPCSLIYQMSFSKYIIIRCISRQRSVVLNHFNTLLVSFWFYTNQVKYVHRVPGDTLVTHHFLGSYMKYQKSSKIKTYFNILVMNISNFQIFSQDFFLSARKG